MFSAKAWWILLTLGRIWKPSQKMRGTWKIYSILWIFWGASVISNRFTYLNNIVFDVLIISSVPRVQVQIILWKDLIYRPGSKTVVGFWVRLFRYDSTEINLNIEVPIAKPLFMSLIFFVKVSSLERMFRWFHYGKIKQNQTKTKNTN